jgi:hypothetical protein
VHLKNIQAVMENTKVQAVLESSPHTLTDSQIIALVVSLSSCTTYLFNKIYPR